MANISIINLIGNVGRDPETRYSPAGKMNVTFTIAVNKRRGNGEEAVNWYRVSAWGRLADILDGLVQQGALVKGRQVYVAGDLDAREYQTQAGETRTSLDVFADKVQLLGARDGGSQPASNRSQGSGYPQLDDVPF